MEQKITPPWTIALVTSLVCIVINMIIFVSNQLMNKSLSYITLIIVVGAIIGGCIYYAKQMNGQVTYGNVFAHGFKITAGIAALMSIYTIISVKFIYPEIIEMTVDAARAEMEKKGKVPTDQMDMALGFLRKFFLPSAIAGSLFGTALIGAIASLIGAGLAKKNPISPFENAS
ncbi:MAG: DUF4199 domain-containing protein [Chitinophagia bacterium]|jgi:NAD/NADP transhydrogenase alpha subunit